MAQADVWKESIMVALRERNKNQHDVHLEVIKSYNRLLESSERYKTISNHQQVELDRLRSRDSGTSYNSSLQPCTDATEVLKLREQLKTSSSELLTVYREQQQLSRQVEEMKKLLGGKEAEVVGLKEALRKADEMNSCLKKKNEQMEQNVSELETAVQCLKDEHTALQMAYMSLEVRCKNLDVQNTQLIKEVVDNKQKIAEFLDKEVEDDNQKRIRGIRQMVDQAVEGFVSIEVPSERMKMPVTSCLLPSKPSQSFAAHTGEVTCVSWKNARVFATGGADRKVQVWEVTNGKVENMFELTGSNAGVTNLCFEYEGNLLLASSNDYACRVWSTSDQRLKSTLTGHAGSVLSAKFMVDSNRVVSGGKDRVVKLWDLKNIACIKSLFIGSMCIDLAVVNSSTFVSGHFDNSLRFWDARSDCSKEHQLLHLSGKVCSLDISADGRYILANTREQVLSLVDTRMTASVVNEFQQEGFRNTYDYNKAIFSPDGMYVAAGSSDEEVYVWNLTSQKFEVKAKSSDRVYALSWSPSGGDFVTGGKNKSLSLWALV